MTDTSDLQELEYIAEQNDYHVNNRSRCGSKIGRLKLSLVKPNDPFHGLKRYKPRPITLPKVPE